MSDCSAATCFKIRVVVAVGAADRAGWQVLEGGRLITVKSLNSGSAPRVWPFGWAGEAHQSRDRAGASTCHSAEAWQWHRPLFMPRKGASVSEREAAIPPFSHGPRENANRAAPYL
ncbi:hypothetical protein QR685DRAFT_571569 [Neurospora intermedia]|uniref:Uncharacterized protein n=1 Tax=Neurospora intermedia TaxID=5142 RepID=A0ABR3DCQ3_NEUIN